MIPAIDSAPSGVIDSHCNSITYIKEYKIASFRYNQNQSIQNCITRSKSIS